MAEAAGVLPEAMERQRRVLSDPLQEPPIGPSQQYLSLDTAQTPS